MIIIQNPEKDTYVTDIQTSSNNGINSNVGQSSTIDLFKISGENRKTHARGLLTFVNSEQPLDGETFILVDALNITKTFEFDNGNGVSNDNIAIEIGNNIAETIDNVVNSVNSVLNFNISSYKLRENKILFKQSIAGESGEKQITVSGANLSAKDFVRFEHSAALLNFKISKLKETHLPDGSVRNFSVFKDDRKFKAVLRLIDVGKSSTRPKDFNLKLNVLNNDFKEGLGKDIVSFSDLDDANFVTLDSKNSINWTNQGIVSSQDLHNEFSFDEFNFKTGKEDLEIDVTNYIHEFFKETAGADKENFVIHFPTDFLFDNNTYFVKRFGSRNLKNKRYIPQLVLKIDDSQIENIVIDKKRYLDHLENFYLLNVKANKTSSFIDGRSVELKFEFIGDNNINIFDNVGPIPGNSVYNYKGEEIVGIKKFAVPDSILSQAQLDSVFLKQLEDLGYVNIKAEYYYPEIGNTPELQIKKVTEKFYPAESEQSEISFNTRNIRVSIDLLQKKLLANNTIIPLNISFIDINKQYKSVNTRTELFSEDLGDINYEMYDVDTGDKIIKEDGVYTQMSFNGRYYVLNLFCSKNFKNKRINFTFRYTDPLTGLDRKVKNDNTILRFV
jgi:hypothetical protein